MEAHGAGLKALSCAGNVNAGDVPAGLSLAYPGQRVPFRDVLKPPSRWGRPSHCLLTQSQRQLPVCEAVT